MTASSQPLSMRRALQLGWSQTVARWPGVLVLFALEAAQVFIVGDRTAVFAVGGSLHAIWAGVGALIAAWLIAELLKVLALGGVLRQSRERLMERPCEPLLLASMATSAQSLSYWWVGGVIAFWVVAYRVLALTSTGVAYAMALVGRQHGGTSSFGFALAICICLPLGFLATLCVELGFARAIARKESYLKSLVAIAGELSRRPWGPVGVFVVTGLVSTSATLTLSALLNWGVFTARGSLLISLAGQVSAGVLAAFVVTLAEVARVNAFLAIELDSEGSLPLATLPPPILALPIASPSLKDA